LEKIGEEKEEIINNNIKSLIKKAKKIIDSRKKSEMNNSFKTSNLQNNHSSLK